MTHCLVPIEQTEEMVEAMDQAVFTHGNVIDAYKAMLATAPSYANTSGLEVVAWRWRFRPDGVWNYQEAQQHIPDVTCEPLVTAASAQAAINAEKVRADRLAKALEDISSGYANCDDFQDAQDIARAALQQETQP